MARLFCSIAERRINLQISSQSHYSRKALNISGNVWVCRKTQQLKLRGSVGINSNCPRDSGKEQGGCEFRWGRWGRADGGVYPIGQGPHHAVIILSAGVIESLWLELWTPPELPTSSAGPHILYAICYILKKWPQVKCFYTAFFYIVGFNKF